MTKSIKIVTRIVLGLLIYGFGVGATYAAHEAKYPGWDENNGKGSVVIATFWPVAAPVWVAYEIGISLFEEAGG